MPSLIWTPEALADIGRLYALIASNHPQAAQRAVDAIRQAAINLERHPELGRPVDDMPPLFRDLIIPFGASAYIARYHVDGDQITMLAARHGREVDFLRR